MEPLPPAGAAALCQLGPRVGGQQLFPETPSLGPGEGVKWGAPLSSQEKEGDHQPQCLCWFWLSASSWLVPSLVLGHSKVGGSRVCPPVSTPRNLSSNALESLSWKTVQGLSLQEL